MAIIETLTAAVIGSLKTSLKRAAIKAAVDIAKSTAYEPVASALVNVGKKAIDDATAALLVRLKVRPDKVLYEYTAKQMGIDTGQIKALLKHFKPTPKQRQAGLAKNFLNLANRQLTKNLNLNKLTGQKAARINDIIKAARRDIEGVLNEDTVYREDKRKREAEAQDIINEHVRERLAAIDAASRERIEGAFGAQDAHKRPMTFHYGIAELFQEGREYTRNHVKMLDDILDNTYNDIENYDYGSGDEVALIGDGMGDWQVTSRKNIEAFIKERYDDTKRVLNVQ